MVLPTMLHPQQGRSNRKNGKFYVPDANDFENGNESCDEDDFGFGAFVHEFGSKSRNLQNKAVLPKEKTHML
eukprot:2882584-Ditylum_brightwellii.AAC.1